MLLASQCLSSVGTWTTRVAIAWLLYRVPRVKERIEALTWVAETPPIPEAGIAVRQGLEPALAKRIFEALMALNAPEYKPLLKKLYTIDGFTDPGPDSDFDVVRIALREGMVKP